MCIRDRSIFNPIGTRQTDSGENVVFHGKIKLFQGKNHSLFVFLLGASFVKKGSEMKFSRNLILFDFSGHLLLKFSHAFLLRKNRA